MPTFVNIAVEDRLSEAVLRRIIEQSGQGFTVGYCYCKGGYGYLKRTIHGFNNAAKGTPFVVLADLEAACPPIQIREWLPIHQHPNLLLRVAVKEIESWLLADRAGFASFLGISEKLIPKKPDDINNPKQCLIDLARRSRKRTLHEAIVPSPSTTAKVGRDYNGQLSSFVYGAWNLRGAAGNSDSLRRAVNAINTFQPVRIVPPEGKL